MKAIVEIGSHFVFSYSKIVSCELDLPRIPNRFEKFVLPPSISESFEKKCIENFELGDIPYPDFVQSETFKRYYEMKQYNLITKDLYAKNLSFRTAINVDDVITEIDENLNTKITIRLY